MVISGRHYGFLGSQTSLRLQRVKQRAQHFPDAFAAGAMSRLKVPLQVCWLSCLKNFELLIQVLLVSDAH